MKTETKIEPFAIVPQTLIADPNITPTDKIIFAYLLGKYQTKRDNGEPWTFSCPSIAKGTALNERTIQRRIKAIRKHGVLKLHGCLMSEKKKYDVFVFVPEALETLIATSDKLSVVIPNAAKGFDAIGKQHPTNCPATADSLSDRMSAKRKMTEGRLEKEDGTNNKRLRSQPPTLPLGVAPYQRMDGKHLQPLDGEALAKQWEDLWTTIPKS
jgi:hypothetical protein